MSMAPHIISLNGQLLLNGLKRLTMRAGDVVDEAAVSRLWSGTGSAGTVELIAAVDELTEAGLIVGVEGQSGFRMTPAGHARIYRF